MRAGVLNSDLALMDVAPLEPVGVVLPPASRRPVVRPCVDWTERCYHVAGELPAALTRALFAREWIARVGPGRAARLTDEGRAELWWLVTDSAAARPA